MGLISVSRVLLSEGGAATGRVHFTFFDAGGEGSSSQARRAIAETFPTISPTSVGPPTFMTDPAFGILHQAAYPLAAQDPVLEQQQRNAPIWEKYSVREGGLNLVLAFCVAGLALNRRRLRLNGSHFLRAPARLLHAIHRGAVGDYAAWLTAGVAVFSGVLLLLFQT
jgi:hypothetical protein